MSVAEAVAADLKQATLPRGGHVTNSNLGNGNLRPETCGQSL